MISSIKENKNRFRQQNLLFLLVILLEWIIIAYSRGNTDYTIYRDMYDATISLGVGAYPDLEYGQRLFYTIGGFLNLNYDQFLLVYVSLGFLILIKGLMLLTNRLKITLILYFIFPFLFDVVQIRNFFAMSVLVYAFHFLLLENEKGSTIKYLIIVLFAGLFHNISFFFLCH